MSRVLAAFTGFWPTVTRMPFGITTCTGQTKACLYSRCRADTPLLRVDSLPGRGALGLCRSEASPYSSSPVEGVTFPQAIYLFSLPFRGRGIPSAGRGGRGTVGQETGVRTLGMFPFLKLMN